MLAKALKTPAAIRFSSSGVSDDVNRMFTTVLFVSNRRTFLNYVFARGFCRFVSLTADNVPPRHQQAPFSTTRRSRSLARRLCRNVAHSDKGLRPSRLIRGTQSARSPFLVLG